MKKPQDKTKQKARIKEMVNHILSKLITKEDIESYLKEKPHNIDELKIRELVIKELKR